MAVCRRRARVRVLAPGDCRGWCGGSVLGIPPADRRAAGIRLGRSFVTATAQSETGTITELLLKHARVAFGSPDALVNQWQALNFTAAPDYGNAIRQYDRFAELLVASGASVHYLPPSADVGLDSIYVRDASVACDLGIILCSMGKALREGEPAAQETALRAMGHTIAGRITPPGLLEGGDVVWLDRRTIGVGRGYRTNDEGIAQLRVLLGDSIDELIVVPLPHWRGPQDVFHLM